MNPKSKRWQLGLKMVGLGSCGLYEWDPMMMIFYPKDSLNEHVAMELYVGGSHKLRFWDTKELELLFHIMDGIQSWRVCGLVYQL